MSSYWTHSSWIGLAGSLAVMGAALIAPFGQSESGTSTGQTVYKNRCASCHGSAGQGGAGYSKPLRGGKSEAELSRYIEKYMPPKGKKLTKGESDSVAAYIHEAFYSALAQERNRPARISLSRLTVRQYQNTLSDLLSVNERVAPNEPGIGLRGHYYKSPGPDGNNEVFNRVDGQVAFDFGTGAPPGEGFDPYKYSVMWQGSLLAPDTGEYDFIVRSNQGVRLFVNDEGVDLIDRAIVSGPETEHHGVITLTGGRTYFIRLIFLKATLGVQEQDKSKQKPPAPAFVTLAWKRPKMAEEVIPARFLYPEYTSKRYVVTAPFPPDDRSIGYERGSSVSKEWDDAATAAALEAAGYAARMINPLAGTSDDAGDRAAKVRAWAERFVERAFRRPLSAEDKALYIDKQLNSAKDLSAAAKRVVLMALKSPRFLYRELADPENGDWITASNLAFGLWDSLPDGQLIQAARSGQLKTPEQIRAQAERMASDPKAWSKLRSFYLSWLKVDEVPDLIKDSKRYPGFTPSVATDLRNSLELFLESNGRSGEADFKKLFTTKEFPINGKLASLYGVSLPKEAPFQNVMLNPEERSGLLGHPYLLSRLAYLETSSPIHRGVLLSRSILGRSLKPPPSAFTPLAASLHPDLTTRERVALQTKPPACTSCHSMINPLGFSLEKFDAIGRLRSEENGRPVDSSGGYQSKSGEKVTFSGARDLANYVANSEDAHGAFVEKLFHHIVKQPVRAYGASKMEELEGSFDKGQYKIRNLMVEIATTTAANHGTP